MIVHECIEIHPKGFVGWIFVRGFMVLLNMHYLIQEILMEAVLDVHVKGAKIKKFFDPDFVKMHLLQKKKFIERYMCWFVQGEPYIPHEVMIERMIGSTSSSSNMREVVNENSNFIGIWLWMRWK